jgi:acetyltransferase-like isoleucine patch superfamily enzyme
MVRFAPTWRDWQEQRIERKLQLLRGGIARWRGAKVGQRFGLGRGVRLLFPSCFSAGDDVSIEDFSFLYCLSARGVRIGNHTSIDRNLWLHCGNKPDDYEHSYFEIGEHSYIGCNAVIGAGGGIRIGSYVQIGQGVNFHAESHVFADSARLIGSQGVTYQGIVVEDDVWIGSKVTILDGVTIENRCLPQPALRRCQAGLV